MHILRRKVQVGDKVWVAKLPSRNLAVSHTVQQVSANTWTDEDGAVRRVSAILDIARPVLEASQRTGRAMAVLFSLFLLAVFGIAVASGGGKTLPEQGHHHHHPVVIRVDNAKER